MLVTSSLRRAAQINPNGLAMTGERCVDWRAFVAAVARLAGGLAQLGVMPGQRVAILSLNRPEFLELQYAVLWAGAVLVPINHRLAAVEMAHVLLDAGADVLALDSEFEALLPQLAAAGATPRRIVSMQSTMSSGGAVVARAELAAAAPIDDRSPAAGDALAAVFYTGGTTGKPKGVMLSQAAFAFQALSMMNALGFERDSVYLHATPMFHLADYGIGLGVTLAAGTHAFLPRFTPAAALERIGADRVTETNLVPTMLAAVLEQADAGHAAALGAIRTIAYGGAPMPETLLRRLMASLPQARFRQFYGMTELCGACATLAPQWHALAGAHAGRLRSAGQSLPYMEIEVAAPDGSVLARGCAGEVVVRGPQLMMGYWNDPEASAAALRDGWMRTGDVGVIDADGFLSVVERIKDMIVTGGENVYSVEVEDVLLAHPGVAACAVVGLPDARWGERIHAVLVARPGSALDEAGLDAFCRQKIAGYKRPRSYEIRIDPLPLGGGGKVQKARLRQEAIARETAPR